MRHRRGGRGAKGVEKRGAEVVVVEGRGIGSGYPLPSRLGGLGERRQLPSGRGPGVSPGRKWILVHFELGETHVVTTNLAF